MKARPYVLINAVTGEVGTGTEMSGYPTNQDFRRSY